MPLQINAKTSAEEKHELDVNTIVIHNGCIYSGADDGKIIKWDENLKKQGEVQAHPCSIYCLAALDDKIYSCSNDGTVKTWTLDLKEIETVFKDDCEFWRVVASDNVVYVGDDQGGIRTIVNGKPYARYEILEGIKDLAVSGNTLFTGKDIDITITSLGEGPKPTFATRKVMQGRAPLTLAGDKLIFVDFPATGFSVHQNSFDTNFNEVATFQGAHTMIINALAANRLQEGEITFFTGSWDKNIKKWKVVDKGVLLLDAIDVELVVNTMIVDSKGGLIAGLADGYLIKVE